MAQERLLPHHFITAQQAYLVSLSSSPCELRLIHSNGFKFPYHKDFYCTRNIIRWENLVNNSCLYVTSAIKAILGKDKTRHGKQMAKKDNSIPSPSFQYQPSALSP